MLRINDTETDPIFIYINPFFAVGMPIESMLLLFDIMHLPQSKQAGVRRLFLCRKQSD